MGETAGWGEASGLGETDGLGETAGWGESAGLGETGGPGDTAVAWGADDASTSTVADRLKLPMTSFPLTSPTSDEAEIVWSPVTKVVLSVSPSVATKRFCVTSRCVLTSSSTEVDDVTVTSPSACGGRRGVWGLLLARS